MIFLNNCWFIFLGEVKGRRGLIYFNKFHYNKDHVQSLLSKTCESFSRKFEVFNEMEMEINVINYEMFTKLYLKIRVREKEIS